MGKATLAEVVRQSADGGFAYVCAGTETASPAELLGRDAMRRFLAEVRETYARVIVDSPPITLVTDAVILASLVDGVVLVARHRRTQRKLVVVATRVLRDVHAKFLGTVLNGVSGRYVAGSYGGYHGRYGATSTTSRQENLPRRDR